MRARLICLALAGLPILAVSTAAPAATQSFRCTDTAAVTSEPLFLRAQCQILVSCPGPASCAVTPQGFGSAVPSVEVRIFVNGFTWGSCSGLFSCQTGKKTLTVTPGSVLTVDVIASGNPLGLLTEARLLVKRTS